MDDKYDKLMMEVACITAKESYCTKAKVGAILAKEGRIVANGYNGTVSGADNVCEIAEKCPTCNGQGRVRIEKNTNKSLDWNNYSCDKCNGTGYRLVTSPLVAIPSLAQNLLAFCAKEGIATKGLTMYITLSPCTNCAKYIVQAGITRVVYLNKYKDESGIKFLQDCGIEVHEL